MEWVIPLITVLASSGGFITAIAAWRRDSMQGPVEARKAQMADAVSINQVASNWVKYQDEKLRELSVKIEQLEDQAASRAFFDPRMIRAAALRDAADAQERDPDPMKYTPGWLRARARMEEEAPLQFGPRTELDGDKK